MRKLLIVDDEKNIRLGLKAMIEREFKNEYEIYVASNGPEALHIIETMNIEILITDIFMPEMDGLQLITLLQDKPNKPVIVIVSGYDDFSYAKAAIHYDVKEYLLKPVVREELSLTIKRIEEDLVRREKVSEVLSASAQQLEAHKESQMYFYSTNLLLEAEEVRNKLSAIGLHWLDSGFRVLIIKYAGDLQKIGAGVFKAQVDGLLEKVKPALTFQITRFFDRSGRAVILTEGDLSFKDLAAQIPLSEYDYMLAVSGFHIRIESFPIAYEEAAQALKYTFLRSTPGIEWYENIKERSCDFDVPVDQIKMIANMLGAGREKELIKLLQEVLDINKVLTLDIQFTEEISKNLNELVFDYVFHLYGKESVDILKRYKAVGDMYNFAYFQDYYREVEGLIMLVNEYIKTLKSAKIDNKEIKDALQYIHENYNKNINMTIISNMVSFNYYYFSQAFRDFTGENFVNYIKKYRIGKAKQLLETTNDKIYEIAANVGFENTKNFNRVFKDIVGVSPMEYRNQKEILMGDVKKT
ncbi:response regulator [Paenibacillus sinopodophylli]|uniref:response regulator n=1 Tax=Paenibacillus sinopodophylli TaxID=1837342 RepID=UPI00110CA5C0|nr:response regulator [Paenibacillus sinopodophylli]